MKYKITVDGRFPSLNEYVEANRTHKHKGNKMRRESEQLISMYVMQQLRNVHIDNPIFIIYHFYEPNKKRDLDNISGYFHKVFQDALVYNNVIFNDNWHYITGFQDFFDIDNKHPRIEVEIIEQ